MKDKSCTLLRAWKRGNKHPSITNDNCVLPYTRSGMQRSLQRVSAWSAEPVDQHLPFERTEIPSATPTPPETRTSSAAYPIHSAAQTTEKYISPDRKHPLRSAQTEAE